MRQEKTELAEKLAEVLSDVVMAKFILHGYHWNVMGSDFGQLHKFFGKLYLDLDSSIDPLAENILKIGFPAPYMLSDYVELSGISERRLDGSDSQGMLYSALDIIEQLYACHIAAFHLAEKYDLQGLLDFLAARSDMYAKWMWQIKSFLGVR
tara:strand:- start:2574 stop:3029 length:456 start_codon:yes stop_codon:yes gene_type:complete